MNIGVLVKARNKQDKTEPDTIIVRTLEIGILFPKLSPEYTTLFFIISTLAPYLNKLHTSLLIKAFFDNFYSKLNRI